MKRRVGRCTVVMIFLCAMLAASVSAAFAAAKITTQPGNKTVLVGDTASFTVVATGSGTLKYQWQSLAPGATTWKNSSAPSATTATLSFTAQAAHNGYKFRCQVTDSSGKPTTSSAAVLTVKAKITTQPKNASVPVGSTAKFTVVATGKAPLKYQWQAYNPSTKKWTDSSSASAKTATLSITAQTGHNGFKFRCIVTDGNGNKTTSSEATLKVLPKITTQPKDVSVKEGGTATFTIAATGKAAISYQWQSKAPTSDTWKNSVAASAKTAKFTFTAALAHQGYLFRCIVTDGNGNQSISKEVKLTLYDIPVTAKFFPDANFRKYVSEELDTDHSGRLSAAEIREATFIYVPGEGIKTIKGIEFFTELTCLDAGRYLYDYEDKRNCISTVDLSRNTKLEELCLSYNDLTSLNVSKNTKLQLLDCEHNRLKSIDVSKNPELQYLYVSTNEIGNLNLRNNPKMRWLWCEDIKLASLDVSYLSNLQWLNCVDCKQLSSLKLPAGTSLSELDVCWCTKMTTVDVSKCTGLKELYVENNGFTTLDVSKNSALEDLYCEGNCLKSLNLSRNPKLRLLIAYDNQLTKLDLTNNTKLTDIAVDSGVTVTGKPSGAVITYY